MTTPFDSTPRNYAERHQQALNVFTAFTGGTVDAREMAASMPARIGAIGSYGMDMSLGDVWARTEISRRMRSPFVVAILAAISNAEELRIHVGGVLNHGATREEVLEALASVAPYAGFPRAMSASRVAMAYFNDLDSGPAENPEAGS